MSAPPACRLDTRRAGPRTARPRWFDGFGRPPYRWEVAVTSGTPVPSLRLRAPGAWGGPLTRRSRTPGEYSREQAHLPAEQPASQPYPRLPAPDADPRGSRDPVRPPRQGSRQALRLSLGPSSPVLPRTARLHESADFRRVTRSGVRSGRPTLVVHAVTGTGPQSRVGFVVSKAVGGAVERNRVKRRLRHLRGRASWRRPPVPRDVVVRALPAASSTPGRVPDDLSSAWAQVLHRLSPGPTRVSP